MALGTLPEDETTAQDESAPQTASNDARDQFAQDSQPGGGGSANGIGLGASSKGKAQNMKGKINGLSKRWKMIAGVGGIIGILAPFILFFMFLFLFKLNHVKELFISYRFAKFNRVVSQRIAASLEAARAVPAGKAGQAPAPKEAPLDLQLSQAKGEGPLPVDLDSPERIKLQADVDAYMKSDLSGSPGADTDSRFKVRDRSVASIDTTKPDADIKAAVDKDLQSKVDDPGKGPGGIPDAEVKDTVDETKKGVQDGGDPKVVVENTATRLIESTGKALSIFSKVTIACIAIDIWGASKKAYIAYKAEGLVKAAESVYAWADGQKQGQVPLAGIGAVASKLDNSQESFVNSAGAQQASGQPITGPGLSDEAKPTNTPPGGNVGKALNFFLGIPKIEEACSYILKPGVQFAVAGAGVVLLVGAVLTPGVNVTVGAVVGSIVAGGAVVFAGIAGKALAVHVVSQMAHTAISANASPLAWGNYMSGGTKIIADNACFSAGCKQLTPAENVALETVIHQERLALDKKKGLAWRLVDTNNPRSVLTQSLFAIPSSPSGMLAQINHFFGTIFSPAKFALSSGRLALATVSPPTAFAADPVDPVTGQPFVGIPLNAPTWPVLENAKYIEANLATFKSKYDKCYGGSSEDYAQRIIDGPNSKCDNLAGDIDAQRYGQYKADQMVIHGIMRLKNKNPLLTAAGVGGSSTTAGGTIDLNTVFQPSDNIGCSPGTNEVGNHTGYHNEAPIQIKLCTLPNLASSSRESSPGDPYYINGANGLALVNSRASGAFLALATAAKAANLPIAATSTFRTMQHQQDLFNGDSGGAEVAPPGKSNHQMGLAIDFSCNGSLVSRGDQCFAWLSQNAGTYGLKGLLPNEPWHWSVTGS